jgi:hypothetical protein
MDYITTNETWKAIDANANIAFQVAGAYSVYLARNPHNLAPTHGISYAPGEHDRGPQTVLFPRSTGNTVWARSVAASAIILG